MTATQWAVTIALAVLNLGTLALLAGTWVYLQARKARKSVKVLRAKVASRRSAADAQRASGTFSAANPLSTASPRGGGGGQSVRRSHVSVLLSQSPRVAAPETMWRPWGRDWKRWMRCRRCS